MSKSALSFCLRQKQIRFIYIHIYFYNILLSFELLYCCIIQFQYQCFDFFWWNIGYFFTLHLKTKDSFDTRDWDWVLRTASGQFHYLGQGQGDADISILQALLVMGVSMSAWPLKTLVVNKKKISSYVHIVQSLHGYYKLNNPGILALDNCDYFIFYNKSK